MKINGRSSKNEVDQSSDSETKQKPRYHVEFNFKGFTKVLVAVLIVWFCYSHPEASKRLVSNVLQIGSNLCKGTLEMRVSQPDKTETEVIQSKNWMVLTNATQVSLVWKLK